MNISVKYFAFYESYKGKNSESITVTSSETVGSLFERLMKSHPLKERLFSSTLFAVNQSYVKSDTVLKEGDEVAFIPPVAGG
jgi:molybdopterin converting factor subunit 1